MQAHEALAKMTAYFGGEQKYASAVIDEILALLKTIDERDLERVVRRMIEDEKASYKVGVSEVLAAAHALGVAYGKVERIATEERVCEACGRRFRYHPCPSDDEKIDQGVFDSCPSCGFQVNWTLTMLGYRQKGRVAEQYTAAHNKRIEAALNPPKEVVRPYFNVARMKAERENSKREERELLVETFKATARSMTYAPPKTIRTPEYIND